MRSVSGPDCSEPFLVRQPHDGVDVEGQSPARTIITMRRTGLQETLIDIDDRHAETVRRPDLRHQPVGDDNHAVAFTQYEILSVECHLTLACLAAGVRKAMQKITYLRIFGQLFGQILQCRSPHADYAFPVDTRQHL